MYEIRRTIAPMEYNTSQCSPHCVCDRCGHKQSHSTTIDPAATANQFFFEYYRTVSNVGWNSVMHLFDQNCIVIVKNKQIGNSYKMLNFFSTEYIKRANYDNIRFKWVILSKDKLLINVFGQIQFVTFNGAVSRIMPFTETFVLTSQGNRTNGARDIKCTHQIIDFN